MARAALAPTSSTRRTCACAATSWSCPNGTIVDELLRAGVARLRHRLRAHRGRAGRPGPAISLRDAMRSISSFPPECCSTSEDAARRARCASSPRRPATKSASCELVAEFLPEPVRSTARAYVYIGRGARKTREPQPRPDRTPRGRAGSAGPVPSDAGGRHRSTPAARSPAGTARSTTSGGSEA